MRKILLLGLLLFHLLAHSQIKLGIKAAPLIISNKVTNDDQNIDNDGSKLKFSVGLIMDRPFSESYYISSGLMYLPKHIVFRTTDNRIREEYVIQYLQIPATIKLFTNEVAPDMQIYFQLGSGLEFKIYDEPKDASYTTIKKFNPIDIPLILGGGVEYRVGISTVLFCGISYQRGVVNTINEIDAAMAPEYFQSLRIKNVVFSIDLGAKF